MSLFRRSLAFLLLTLLAVALVFSLVGFVLLDSVHGRANESALLRAALSLAAAFPAAVAGGDGSAAGGADLAQRAAAYAASAAKGGYRVTIILPDGRVLADSEADPATMENHATRPEVAAAIAGRATSSSRRSATLGVDLLYAAAPMGGELAAATGAEAQAAPAVLRLALHRPALELALEPARWTFALAALVFILAAIGAAAGFAAMMSRPLASIAAAARAYARGEAASSARAAIRRDDPEEIRLLADTLDGLAREVGERIVAAKAQGKELEAILDAIAEAVLALDAELRISLSNPAADELFGLVPSPGSAKSLLEATRSSALQAFAHECLQTGQSTKAEISLFLPAERVFQAFAAPLGRPQGETGHRGTGLVIVLNDISELRRLERVRRDFVANVSHELRTPVQLVKGFAESLEEGGLDDPLLARRFVGIIGKNASRMESLIGDLLSLASLEREGREWLKTERKPIRPILESAIEALGPKAEARGSLVLLECGEGLAARVDAGLLEQAIVNLVDNAIKYSPQGSTVRIAAREEASSLIIEVRDQGMGIPASDLPRVFERFYRVDKARSRELGGTGLGLAIVRHIAMAHGGGVSVESWEGEGSTFRLSLPLG